MEKDYIILFKKVNDISRIIPLEADRIWILFTDGVEIETTYVDFNDDGSLEFGYIYE